MLAPWVKKQLYIIKDIPPRILTCFVYLSLYPFTLEQLKEAFCHSIVMSVATPTHTADQVVLF